MASTLVEIYRHNRWANLRLLDRCASLTEEQLALSAPGTFGPVGDTLVHLVGAEQRYVAALLGQPPGEALEASGFPGFARLSEAAAASGDALIRIASADPAGDALSLNRRGQAWRIDPAHFLVQAVNHATEHRAQVVGILTQNSIEVPDLDGWAFSRETGLTQTV